jgi:hypothetical protein
MTLFLHTPPPTPPWIFRWFTVRSRSRVPVDLVTTNETTPDRGFWGGPTNETTPDRGFWGGPTNETTPQWGFFGGGLTGPAFETGFQLKKKNGRIIPIFFSSFEGEGKGYGKRAGVPCVMRRSVGCRKQVALSTHHSNL